MKFKKIAILFIFIIFSFLCVFWLPFFVKPSQIAVSSAYDYGFNNSIAICSILVFIFAGTIIALTSFKSVVERTEDFDLFGVNNEDKISQKHFGIVFGIYFVVILALYLLNAQRGYAEANYFFNKLDRLSIRQVPYADFEYAYGLLFIYLPKYLSDFIKIFGLGLKEAYYFVFLLFNLIGLYLFYYTVNLLNIAENKKLIIFYSIAIPAYPLSLGFNYIFIRFITPFVSIIALDNILKKSDGDKLKTQAVLLLLVSLFTILNFLISTEIGIVFSITISVYLLSTLLSTRNKYLILTILGYIITLSLFLVLQKNYYLALKSFSSGGNNWTIIPSPSILIYLASLFFISAISLARYLKYRKEHLLFVLGVLNICMMPGAMGRCDPIHVFWYGIGVFIITMAYIAKSSLKRFRIYSLSFILVFVVGMSFSGIYLWKEDLARIFIKKIESTVSEKQILGFALKSADFLKMDKSRMKEKLEKHFQNRKADLSGPLSKYEKIATPLVIDAETYDYLVRNNKFVPEYYSGLQNVFTSEQITAKMAELENDAHKFILVNKENLDLGSLNSDDNIAREQKIISLLFLYPFNLRKIRNTAELYLPLYDYIKSNYRIISKIKNNVLLERKD